MHAVNGTKTVETRKPVKGDTVYVCGLWSGFTSYDRETKTTTLRPATIYVRELRVESWGKVRATFTDPVTGEFIRAEGSVPVLAWAFTPDRLGHFVEAIKAAAVELFAKSIANSAAWLVDHAATSRADVVATARREHAERVEFVPTFTVVGYHSLKAGK